MPDEQTADRPPEPMTEGPDETDQPQDDLARALAEGPLDWPEDDTPPPPDPQLKGIGLPPPGGGVSCQRVKAPRVSSPVARNVARPPSHQIDRPWPGGR